MGTMNSINWHDPNVWVFIAQLVEHCSTNPEAMGSNPVEAPKTFFRLSANQSAYYLSYFIMYCRNVLSQAEQRHEYGIHPFEHITESIAQEK